MRPITTIHNTQTGEVISREMNDEELSAYENRIAFHEAKKLAEKVEADAKAQAKTIAEGKLAALGLTADDLKALGL
jgi:hypothetical protein